VLSPAHASGFTHSPKQRQRSFCAQFWRTAARESHSTPHFLRKVHLVHGLRYFPQRTKREKNLRAIPPTRPVRKRSLHDFKLRVALCFDFIRMNFYGHPKTS
jgi:hypothetical protein